jgi:hypothetical protein
MPMPLQLQQLYQFYYNAFHWLEQNVEHFNPLKDGSDTLGLYQTKALGELGLLCMLYHRSAKGDVEPAVELYWLLVPSVRKKGSLAVWITDLMTWLSAPHRNQGNKLLCRKREIRRR